MKYEIKKVAMRAFFSQMVSYPDFSLVHQDRFDIYFFICHFSYFAAAASPTSAEEDLWSEFIQSGQSEVCIPFHFTHFSMYSLSLLKEKRDIIPLDINCIGTHLKGV